MLSTQPGKPVWWWALVSQCQEGEDGKVPGVYWSGMLQLRWEVIKEDNHVNHWHPGGLGGWGWPDAFWRA